MKQTRLIMGMPITVEIVACTDNDIFKEVFSYFQSIDERFSTYKNTSEISKINRGETKEEKYSKDMQQIFKLSRETEKETNGYFNIKQNGKYDPSGIVKGWAIQNAAEILKKKGYEDFFIDAGGDIQVSGKNSQKKFWTIGIKSPFKQTEIVKVIVVKHNEGVATSGTYIRGQHIYNPHNPNTKISEIVSMTVIGPNVYEADRFATAAFAMGRDGIFFLERLDGFEAYIIDTDGIATVTSGFKNFVKSYA